MTKHINSHISQVAKTFAYSNDEESHTMLTGYPSVDSVIGGIQTRKTYLVLDEDDSVSSDFIYNLILNFASNKNVVLFIHLFYPAEDSVEKLSVIAKQNGISKEKLSKLPIFIENEIPGIDYLLERIMNYARFTHIKILIIKSLEDIFRIYEIESVLQKRDYYLKLNSLASEYNIALIIGHVDKEQYNLHASMSIYVDWIIKLQSIEDKKVYEISYTKKSRNLDTKTKLEYNQSKYTFIELNSKNQKSLFKNYQETIKKNSPIKIPFATINSNQQQTNSQGELCPVCGNKLIFTEGCKKCVNCEYSACGG